MANHDNAGVSGVDLGTWEQLGAEARKVRELVYVVEQRIPVELEWDEWDTTSLHAIARDGQGRAIGTGRLLPVQFDPAAPGCAHVGRMAVLAAARYAGAGGRILRRLMEAARGKGFSDMVLNAQTYVAAFYVRHGFVAEGEEFSEAGIPHRRMRAVL